MLDWTECAELPDTEIVLELARFAPEDRISTKPGYAGLVGGRVAALLDSP